MRPTPAKTPRPQPSPPAAGPWSPRLARWSPALLVAAIALTYANSLVVPFLFDDLGAVVNNPTIRDLFSSAVFAPPADGSTATGRPLVNLTFALNYAVSGARPWSYHATNVALHALAALALLGLARRTLDPAGPTANGLAPVGPPLAGAPSRFARDNRDGAPASGGPTKTNMIAGNVVGTPSTPTAPGSLACFIALLWALHPLQTETVVCVAQRTELLCGLLYLVTLYGFVRATAPTENNPRFPRPFWLFASVAACLL
ncbi:MAG: hypothetical protein RLZZ15_2841, partial [Verrucomicrobiota bacterium]